MLFGLLVNKAHALVFNIDLSIGAYSQSPSGTIKYKGDYIDVNKDLSLDKGTGFFTRLRFEHILFSLPDVYIQYTPMKFDGQTRLTRSITYGGTTYQANSEILSSFRVNRYDVALYKGLPFENLIRVDPKIGVNARIVEIHGKITGNTSSGRTTKSMSEFVVVPVMLYASLGVSVPMIPVSVRGEARILYGSDLKYEDLSAELRVKPIRPVYASVGHRWEKLKVEDVENGDTSFLQITGVYSDLKIRGLFAVVGFEF